MSTECKVFLWEVCFPGGLIDERSQGPKFLCNGSGQRKVVSPCDLVVLDESQAAGSHGTLVR